MVEITLFTQDLIGARDNKNSRVPQPISVLPNWSVISNIFSYFGFTYEVFHILVQLGKSTKMYVTSHHRKVIKSILLPNISWNSKWDLPEFLNRDMVKI